MFKAIQLYISSDIQTALTPAASSVYALNSDQWSSVAEMPDFTYKPFGVIWVGTSAASADVSYRIVYKLGQNFENAQGEITLLGCPLESNDVGNEGLHSTENGAETMYLDIVLRLPEEKQNFDKIVNAEARLRWLLDENWRKNRRGVSPYIPNLGDNLIGGNLRLRWARYMVPPNAKEVWSRYIVSYNRLIPRG